MDLKISRKNCIATGILALLSLSCISCMAAREYKFMYGNIGEIFSVITPLGMTVKEFNAWVADKNDIPEKDIKIEYKGKTLKDAELLGIKEDALNVLTPLGSRHTWRPHKEAITLFVGAETTVRIDPSIPDGVYKCMLDVPGSLPNKVWTFTVVGAQKTVQRPKGMKAQNISIKDNVITVRIGLLKNNKADDLKVIALKGPLAGQLGSLGIVKPTSNFTIKKEQGFALNYLKNEKAKPGKPVQYELTVNSSVPDGSYTLKLVRPAAKDKAFNFDVKGGTITKVIGDPEGALSKGLLTINAQQMCASRRAKEAIAISVCILGMLPAWSFAAGLGLGKLLGEAALAGSEAAAEAASGIFGASTTIEDEKGAFSTAAIAAGIDPTSIIIVGNAAGVAAPTAPATFATKPNFGIIFGFREAEAQIICDKGPMMLIGKQKAVSTGYEECRNNKWELSAVTEKLLVTSEPEKSK